MIQCTNCGQVNSDTSNFCRFCGTKFLQTQTTGETNYEYSPPSPYSWKTDEFQVTETRKTVAAPFKQIEPSGNPRTTNQSAQPLAQRPTQNVAFGYHCPRCSSQSPPIFTRRVSTAGWITFAVLLVTTGIFFWVGLLIREDVQICPVCSFRISST